MGAIVVTESITPDLVYVITYLHVSNKSFGVSESMNTFAKIAAVGAIAALLAGCESAGSVVSPSDTQQNVAQTAASGHRLTAPLGRTSIVPMTASAAHLCAATDSMHATCLSSVRMDRSRDTLLSGIVDGLTPTDLANIYGYTSSLSQGSTNQVVGIVVAYDYANAESDLAAYRAKYGLAPCSTANGCFKKVGAAASAIVTTVAGNPTSISAHPTSSASGWAAEADADTQAVSAVCKNCKIVLAEAASDSLTDLGAAEQAALSAGANVVNESFGAPESASQSSLVSMFAGSSSVKIVAAAGDNGRGVLFPASLPSVVAVAGTTLNTSLGVLVTESLWSGSGGGCSTVFARASFQPAWCGSKRSVADVAVVADPADGIAFYDSGLGGWGIVGGTSIAAPIVASMYALSGGSASGSGAHELYSHALLNFAPVANAGLVSGLGAPLSLAAF